MFKIIISINLLLVLSRQNNAWSYQPIQVSGPVDSQTTTRRLYASHLISACAYEEDEKSCKNAKDIRIRITESKAA